MSDHAHSVGPRGGRGPIEDAISRHPRLRGLESSSEAAFGILDRAASGGGTIFTCGNGGSAADAEHFVAELMKGFEQPRPIPNKDREALSTALADRLQVGIKAVPLTGFTALRTAIANDTDPALEFAQIVYTLAGPSDALLAISTSGNSTNIALAAEAASSRGASVVALTGASGGRLADLADIAVKAPATRTLEVQEFHLPIYHTLALMLESSAVDRSSPGPGRR